MIWWARRWRYWCIDYIRKIYTMFYEKERGWMDLQRDYITRYIQKRLRKDIQVINILPRDDFLQFDLTKNILSADIGIVTCVDLLRFFEDPELAFSHLQPTGILCVVNSLMVPEMIQHKGVADQWRITDFTFRRWCTKYSWEILDHAQKVSHRVRYGNAYALRKI